MSAVIIYTVVIKEGAIPKLLEMLLIVLVGCESDRSRTSNRSDCRYDFGARLRPLVSYIRDNAPAKFDIEVYQILLHTP